MKTSHFFPRTARLVAAVVAGVCLSGLSSLAAAQESRIAVVNSQRLMAESNLAKTAQAKLEKEFSARTTEIQEMAKRMQDAIQKFQKDEAVLAESERVRRQKELVDADLEFRRKQEAFSNDLNQRKNEELGRVLDTANSIIRQIAEQRKYDLIVQDVVYFNPRIDITDEVLRNMNKAK